MDLEPRSTSNWPHGVGKWWACERVRLAANQADNVSMHDTWNASVSNSIWKSFCVRKMFGRSRKNQILTLHIDTACRRVPIWSMAHSHLNQWWLDARMSLDVFQGIRARPAELALGHHRHCHPIPCWLVVSSPCKFNVTTNLVEFVVLFVCFLR